MTRKALIIVCPGIEGQSGYLAGTLLDKKNYHDFLYSQIGGDWYHSEITELINPTVGDVQREIKAISQDYSFIVYSGHGGISTTDNTLYLCLTDGDLSINLLKTTAKRQTIIIDSCRSFFTPSVNDNLVKMMSESISNTISNARKVFEDGLAECDEGIIILYSSKPGQASGDEPRIGGVFSSSLIKVGKEWGKNRGANQILSLDTAFNSAVNLIKTNFPLSTQEPEINGGRRNKYFPFALRPGSLIYG